LLASNRIPTTKEQLMKRNFRFSVLTATLIAAGMTSAANAATINLTGGGTGTLATAVAGAAAGDVIVIGDSLTYSNAGAITIPVALTISAGPGFTPTIQNTSATGQVFVPNQALTVIGDSSANRITIQTTGAHTGGQPLINSGAPASATHGISLTNVTLMRQGTGQNAHLSLNNSATAYTLTNVNFVGGSGSVGTGIVSLVPAATSAGMTITMSNVDFSAATTNTNRLNINNMVTVINASNSVLTSGATVNSAFLNLTVSPTGTYTFDDCTFGADNAVPFAGLTLASAANVTLNRPVFNSGIGVRGFQVSAGSLTINGTSAASKSSLDGLAGSSTGSVIGFRMLGGTLNLNRVSGTSLRSAGGAGALIDSDGTLTGNVALNFTQCDFQNGAGSYRARVSTGGSFGVTVTGTNTIWEGLGASGPANIVFSGTGLGPSSLNLTHCTFFAPSSSNLLFLGNVDLTEVVGSAPGRGDTLTSKYSLYDGTGGVGVSNLDLLDSTGSPNLVQVGSVFGFTGPSPAGTVFGVGPIDSTGRLTGVGAAAGAATASTAIVDVDGGVRPNGGTTPDIGAFESTASGSDVQDWESIVE